MTDDRRLCILNDDMTKVLYIGLLCRKCNVKKFYIHISLFILKALSRNQVALSLSAKLYQVPVTNVGVNADVYKKANGYRPFMFNITTDFCRFIKYRKQTPFGKMILDAVEKYSNINHTCPYDHDIIIKDLVLESKHLQSLPWPMGDYLLKISFAVNNDWKVTVKSYIQVTEE
ncbi:uncharacterized protein LOC118739094 [Rhagoletis pomonella]|uniref:uncharacterized protein LOC118739094 n=1 Tax=Rhagoletis pomonella TaxID=28610 RepID=UPI00178320EB|nr:uncharacterized protein LOC118739094 [Rhagoletis pomonella]